MRQKKLGLIVPYRNRKEHLHTFKVRLSHYLKNKEIPFEIIIVNQDDGKLFNRGMLLNIGFKYAKKLKCDYVIFHDVDMIPIDVDYSYSEIPLHLATNFVDKKTLEPTKEIFEEYFGGVTLFPTDVFEKINGYSNKYWGWGYEDTDLLLRCRINDIPLDDLRIKNTSTTGTKLRFNGLNSHVIGKNYANLLNFNSPLSVLISFYPDDITLNHEIHRDDFTLFSIPGFNTDISYNSFMRYTFRTFDKNENNITLYSEIKTNYQTTVVLTFDPNNKIITMYQDGMKIGFAIYTTEVHNYLLEQVFYIGCGKNEDNLLGDFYKGYFNKLAIYNTTLTKDEIKILSDSDINLVSEFDGYKSNKNIVLYYDTNYIKNYQLIDLSGNQNNGIIKYCEVCTPNFDDYKIVKIPYRKKSLFYTLKHEENGFVDNKWKSGDIRWNQLRFHNEVSKNTDLCKSDGLSDLKYALHGKVSKDNITQLNVGI